MKSIKKFLFIMVALAATLAFFSCSNGDDDGDDGVVAVYKSNDVGVILKITCFDNGTWEMIEDASGAEPEMWGTYEGNPSSDGDVKITATDDYRGKLEEPIVATLSIKNGSFEFDGATFKLQ
ncbi:MAG: hypothetical protein K2N58_01080 [Treponemataceae bacterium]|nr:hypothetical protein [Treponemataceae bacterium]